MAEVRVTQTGAYAESEGSGVQITQSGAYAELSKIEVRTTQMGAYAEMILREIRATQFGVYAELAEVLDVATYEIRPRGGRGLHLRIPDVVSGYAFDPIYSWWSSVIPEASINYIEEPSFEIEVINYQFLAYNVSSGRVTGDAIGATRGAYSFALITSGGFNGTFWYETPSDLLPGVWTLSMDVYVPRIGVKLKMQASLLTGDIPIAHRVFTFSRTGWQRIRITYVTLVNDQHKLSLISPDTNPDDMEFRTDGWMLENKEYDTTYFDGDMLGWYDMRPNQSYYWEGLPHRSISMRSERTGSGGRQVSFSEFAGFQSMGITGLGMPPVENVTVTLHNGRELSRGTRFLPRDFTIAGVLCADSWFSLSRKRQELIDLVSAHNTLHHEPLVLAYNVLSDDGDALSGRLQIVCKYQDGLAGAIESEYQERLGLVFHASDPFLKEEFDTAVEIDVPFEELVANAILYRDRDGVYQNLGQGDTDGFVFKLLFDIDLLPIALGSFTEIGGDIATYVARWTGNGWVETMATPPDDIVYNGHVHPETGGLVIVGAFTAVDNISAERVAYYNPEIEDWEGPGGITNGTCTAIELDHYTGDYFLGGEWTIDTGLSQNVARISVAAFSGGNVDTLPDGGLEGPSGGSVTSIVSTHDGYIYFGGNFLESEGGLYTDLYRVARLNLRTEEWEQVGNGFNAPPTKLIRSIDGYIYAFGGFTRDGLDTYDLVGIARWNGSTWEQAHTLNTDPAVFCHGATQDNNGVFWFWNNGFWFDSEIYNSQPYLGWRNGVLYPAHIYPPPLPDDGFNGLHDIEFGPNNEMLVAMAGSDPVVPMYAPKQFVINYSGNARAYPLFVFRGRQTLATIYNMQTDASIYFRRDATLSTDERLFIDLRNAHIRVYSDFRPNLIKTIYSGASNLDKMYLRPGVNRVSVLAIDVSEENPPISHIIWNNTYQSIDIAPEIL